MLLLALAATLGFQVFALSPFVARAVPPVGLALAILVLDLGPGKPRRAIDLEGLEEQQAELEAKVEAEHVQLEEQWEKARLRRQVRGARKRAVELGAAVIDFTVEDWLALLEEFEYRCAYCDADDLALAIEHRTPLSRGGEHTKANIVPACEPCNMNKANKTEEEWTAHRVAQPETDLRAQAAQRVRHRERPPDRRAAQRTGSRIALSKAQHAEVVRRVAQGDSALSISRDLGLSHRGYKTVLLPLVRDLVAQNGDRPKEPVP
jgi:5-methylcytosine-specific restriction endonuclease McrA